MLIVTDEAANQDLTTLEAVKAALDIAGDSEDETLPPLISQASAAIAGLCNRVFIEEGVEETLRHSRGEPCLILSRYPITEITSVTENGAAVDPSDYEADLTTGMITRLSNDRESFWQAGKIVVAYTAGYLVADVPGDLVQATIGLVAQYRSQGGRDPLVRSVATTDLDTIEYVVPNGDALPSPIESLVMNHRKPAGA